MTHLIATDMQLFGFPVYFDWRVDRNVVELRNASGQRIRIEILPSDAVPARPSGDQP